VTKIFDFLIVSIALSTSCSFNSKVAPKLTAIAFLPVLSTRIVATDVGLVLVNVTFEVLILSFSKMDMKFWPNKSLPNLLIKVFLEPNLELATMELAPLPPGKQTKLFAFIIISEK